MNFFVCFMNKFSKLAIDIYFSLKKGDKTIKKENAKRGLPIGRPSYL